MAKSYRTKSLPGIKACIDKMRADKKGSPLKQKDHSTSGAHGIPDSGKPKHGDWSYNK